MKVPDSIIMNARNKEKDEDITGFQWTGWVEPDTVDDTDTEFSVWTLDNCDFKHESA